MTKFSKTLVDQAKSWFARAIEINAKTEYCVDVHLTGNWNQLEIRVYWSKSIKDMTLIIWETVDFNKNDNDKQVEEIETVFYNIEQDF